ncbi:MAG: hypothetical protein K1X61_08810 [Chitinophagales bacterium]|nr:hypothetical protein [Chitinophagales bacterium]
MQEESVPEYKQQQAKNDMLLLQCLQQKRMFIQQVWRMATAACILILLLSPQLTAKQVSTLTAVHRHGQVFLTWNNHPNNNNYYKVYRSLSPILHGSQLAGCEYLGWVSQKSAIDFDLTAHFKQNYYLAIDSGGTPLAPTKGLMVATTLVTGTYYYAVTILFNGSEDTTITYGINSLATPVTETVATPLPVFQRTLVIGGSMVEAYANFISFKISVTEPPVNAAGFLATDFLLYRNNSTGHQPLVVYWHGGGTDFFANIAQVTSDEMNLNIEQLFPSGAISGYWGGNSGYNIYTKEMFVPVSGINYNYYQARYRSTIDWAIRTLDIDSNRIYYHGSSAGACGAILSAVTYPEKIAAVTISVPCFNVGFMNDSVTTNSFNAGGKNRIDVDRLLGQVSTNLPTNLGDNTFDVVNCAWLLHKYKTRDLPPIYAINGKMDSTVGWTEKTVYYDSVTANAAGGYYFWDQRSHGAAEGFWTIENFDLFRYRRNCSYPAFSKNSLDEDPGNGSRTSGELYGSVNGSLDWTADVSDSINSWTVRCFVRNLYGADSQLVVYPESALVSVTPRRLQQFHPPENTIVTWKVFHRQQVSQSGSILYRGGLITLDSIRIYKDTIQLQLQYSTTDTLYEDLDEDSFGNAGSWLMGSSSYAGYVTNRDDCNDNDAGIHPGATENCNSADDNCNNLTDEGTGYRLYADADGDGFGNVIDTVRACDAMAGYVADASDCNDNVSSMHPGAEELCNDADDNCDGTIDENVRITFYADADADGYGNKNETTYSCVLPAGYSMDTTDCNDADAGIHPGASETCNDADDDCNMQSDDGLVQIIYYPDDDADGYGREEGFISTCQSTPPSGYATNTADCNDGAATIFPGATEVCNSLDDDCDTQVDEEVVPAVISPTGNITICAGSGQLLQAEVSTSVGYQWIKDGTAINGATDAAYIATEDGTYSVLITSGSCSQLSPGTTVNSKALPKSTITPAGTIKLCPGLPLLLKANTGNDFTYQWMYEGLPVTGATGSEYNAVSAGGYVVMVTNNAGCTKASPVTTLQNYAGANAKITVTGDLNICSTGSVQLNAKVNAGYTYQWYLNNAVIAGATGESFTAAVAGKYKYLATTANGCSDFSGKKTVAGCRLDGVEATAIAGINIYPNPADGIFYADLQLPQQYEGAVSISVINYYGQTVYAAEATIKDGMLHQPILAHAVMPAGTYLIKVTADQILYIGSVVIID